MGVESGDEAFHRDKTPTPVLRFAAPVAGARAARGPWRRLLAGALAAVAIAAVPPPVVAAASTAVVAEIAADSDVQPSPAPVSPSTPLPTAIARLSAGGAAVSAAPETGGLKSWEIIPQSGPPYFLLETPAGGTVFGLAFDAAGDWIRPPFSKAAQARLRALTDDQRLRALTDDRSAGDAIGDGTTGALKGGSARSGEGIARPADEPAGSIAPPPAATAPPGAAIAARIEALSDARFLTLTGRLVERAGFTIGPGGPALTAFLDPGCPYSRALYRQLAPLAEAGELRLRVIPIDVLGERADAVRAVIAAPPAQRRALWERALSGAEPPPDAHGADRAGRILAVIEAAFARWNPRRSVPFTIFRGQDGGMRELSGLPDGRAVAALLAGAGGEAAR